MQKISLGFSPCPNDTFMFDAMINGPVNSGEFKFELFIEDVEQLNQRALQGMLDVTKISFGALGDVIDKYQLLPSGAALGYGVGPLLISKKEFPSLENEVIQNLKVAIPGNKTTAALLFKSFFPGVNQVVPMLFSEIETEIISGKVDAGVVIHENRFTYQEKGLLLLADLGAMWEEKMQSPLPLGGIVVKRNLDKAIKNSLSNLLNQSIQEAFRKPTERMEFVRKHASEMDLDVMKKHIDLYVTQQSLLLDEKSRNAIFKLMEKVTPKRNLPHLQDLFI